MLSVFLALLFQPQLDTVRAAELAEKSMLVQIRAHSEREKERERLEKKRFVAKFEALCRAVDAFTLAYNAGGGNIWPKKESEALAKAIRELESTSSWRLVGRDSRKPEDQNRAQ